jgi:hypothetical protein
VRTCLNAPRANAAMLKHQLRNPENSLQTEAKFSYNPSA